MLGRSFLVPVHPHHRATPLSIFLFFRLFHPRPPASSLSPLFSFLLLALPPPPILCSTSSMWPGIVQLKCRNCPLEFILKFVAREPFISSRCFAIYPRPPTLILRCDKYKRIPIIFDGILSFSVQNSTCKRAPFPKCLYSGKKQERIEERSWTGNP